MTRLQGLGPLITPTTRVLVLGSFPGLRSLQLQQYYAHPQNQFWPILRSLWPQAPWPDDGDYARRCAEGINAILDEEGPSLDERLDRAVSLAAGHASFPHEAYFYAEGHGALHDRRRALA